MPVDVSKAVNNYAPSIDSAVRTLNIEIEGMRALRDSFTNGMGESFINVVEEIDKSNGQAILTGIGKSGHIARKIASTLASTGTPSVYVHPSEASHGDLGMIRPNDVIIAFSLSGETQELKDVVAYANRYSVTLVACTGNADSALAKASDYVLLLPKHDEACPNGLAPTTSTIMQLALGDALALALIDHKGFSSADFKTLHPGGRLGAALLHASDIMHSGNALPIVKSNTPMSEALLTMTEKSFGCVGVISEDGSLVGVITDGDLRRHMSTDLFQQCAVDIMTNNPVTVSAEEISSSVLEILNTSGITSIFVVNGEEPVGIVHIHDLLRAGVM